MAAVGAPQLPPSSARAAAALGAHTARTVPAPWFRSAASCMAAGGFGPDQLRSTSGAAFLFGVSLFLSFPVICGCLGGSILVSQSAYTLAGCAQFGTLAACTASGKAQTLCAFNVIEHLRIFGR